MVTTFANGLEPDQDQKNVSPVLDPDHLTLIMFLKEHFEKVNFEKKPDNKNLRNYPACELIVQTFHNRLCSMSALFV